MSLPRPLAALLVAALVLSSSPATALAGSGAPGAQQTAAAATAAAAPALLVLDPPTVALPPVDALPPQGDAFDAAGYVNIAHAHHYAAAQAQLDALLAQGVISGYRPQPAAYAFAISGANGDALAALASWGRIGPTADMAAAAALEAAYARQLSAAIAGAAHEDRPALAPALAPPAPAQPAWPEQLPPDADLPQPAPKAPMAPAMAPASAAAGTPLFEVYLEGNVVSVSDIAPLTAVTATLKNGGGVVKGQGSVVTGNTVSKIYLTDIYGNDAKIRGGDVVEVQATELYTIAVVNLQAAPDIEAMLVNGFGPPNITSNDLMVLPNLWVGNSGYVTTTETGAFSTFALSMTPGDYWWLTYTDEQANRITLNWGVPNLAARGYADPWESAYGGDTVVSGRMVQINAPVTVTLTRPGSATVTNTVRTDDYGHFELLLRDQYGNFAPILGGDQVQASDGVATSTVVVPQFNVTSDFAGDTVGGFTDAPVLTNSAGLSQTLSLWPMSLDVSGYGKTVLTTAGVFGASNPYYFKANTRNRAQTLNWGPGQRGHLRYFDAAGNAVFDDFRAATAAPLLALRSQYGSYAPNYVTGDLNNECVTGAVTLLDAAGALKAQANVNACDSFTVALDDVYDNPVPIVAGDRVQTVFNGQTTTVQAPDLVLAADAQSDTVWGRIDAGLVTTTTFGAPQSLAIYGSRLSINVQPDAGGAFSASFAGVTDIEAGATGRAIYVDAAGNEVLGEWVAPFDQPSLSLRGRRFEGYLAENFVAVHLRQSSCDDSRPLDLAVTAGDGAVRWEGALPVCGAGVEVYLEDDFGNHIDLNGGDRVQATFAGQTTAVTLPTFADLVSDHQRRVVSGVTNAQVVTTALRLTQTLAVWPTSLVEAAVYGKQVLVAAGGVFSATNPFYYTANPSFGSTNLGWEAGARGHLRYIDAAGNHVYADFAALPTATRLTIFKGENRVEGQVPAAGLPLTVTLMSGATLKATAYAVSTLYGEFTVRFFDGGGNPVEISEGDQVLLADPPTGASVPPLSVYADVDNDRLTGRGPASALLNVRLDGSSALPVATDAEGAYALDLRGVVDLEAGVWVAVDYLTAEGHTVRLYRPAGAMLSAALANNRVWGYAPVESVQDVEITVTVLRGGALAGRDSFTGSGNFTAYPVDATGKPLILGAGDEIQLDLGAGVIKSITLAPLTLVANEAANTLSGSGPAASRLALDVQAEPLAYSGTVLTDGGGQWGLDLNTLGRDLQAGNMVTVRYSTNGVDGSWLYGVVPVFTLRAGAENSVTGYAMPYAPLTVALKRNDAVLAVAFATAGENGAYAAALRDVNGLNANIAAGDVVEVTSAGAAPGMAPITVSVSVPVLQIFLDSGARTVSGVGPPNSSLGLITSAGKRTVKTDASGAFSTSFAGEAVALTSARLYYREPGGNWIVSNTVLYTGGPAYLVARYDGEYDPSAVSGSTGAGLRPVELVLRRNGWLAGSAYAWTSANGSFSAFFRNAAGPVEILAGDEIEMVAGDVRKAMIAPPLTAQANLQSQTVYGSGPPNTVLWSPDCGSTTVDPAGAWTIECSRRLDNGDSGYVYVTDLLGNTTWLAWSAPGVRVRTNSSFVSGTVAPGADVLIQLRRRAIVWAETSVTASASNGSFAATLFTAGGNPLVIQPDDVIVIDAGQPITVPVGPLTAAVDVPADRVTGVGPPSDQLEVYAANAGSEAARLVTTGDDGRYTADFSGALDLRSGSWIEVEHVNAEGNSVWLGLHAPLLRINLSSDIVDGYAAPNAPILLTLKRGGAILATEQTATSVGGGYNVFFEDSAGSLIDLLAGDVVEVTAGDVAGAAAPPPMAAASALALTASLDQATDTVRGSAPAGSMLLIVAWRCGLTGCYSHEMTTVAAADGVYSASFGGSFDLDQTSYSYVQASDAAGNQTSTASPPAEMPQLKGLKTQLAHYGALLLNSSAGTANADNLTPPMTVEVLAGGRLILAAQGGSLVIISPEGTTTRTSGSQATLENPVLGVWKVQVAISGGAGSQYVVAAGLAQYNIYMPEVGRQE